MNCYRVGQGDFTAAAPFNDPWTPRQLEPADKRLLAFRRQMAEEFAAKPHLPDSMLLQEANLLRQAGQLEEAELALRDLQGPSVRRIRFSWAITRVYWLNPA